MSDAVDAAVVARRPATVALRVLLLEDSRFDAELLSEYLRSAYPLSTLQTVADEAGFHAALAGQRFDLILSDYELPGFSGEQALQHALHMAPGTPFIFVSGVIGEDNAVEMLKRGATDYVSKGRLTRLELVIERALREVAAREARDRAEKQLRAAKEDAERANRAKDRFLAVLSHELRTPLTPIASAVHVLARYAGVPARYQGLLAMIQRNVALEARLIDDLLDLTAISAGKLMLRRGPVDMHHVIRSVVEMLAETILEKRLDLQLNLEAAEPVVDADEARMQQVVWNIVRNAVKFTPGGGRVGLLTRSEPGWFTLACDDSGIGIDPAALQRIFAAFEQADGDTFRRHGGLGLGLAIARGLVAEHGGALEADSDGLGRGATFTLRLPCPTRPRAAAQAGAVAQAVARDGTAAGNGCRLLLVEDNMDTADALALSLESLGYEVTLAMSVAEAVALLQQRRFDVAVTDIGLPDGCGIELGRRLGGTVPLIALSGYGSAQDVRRSVSAGFSGHLVKPAGPDVVHSLVQQVLARAATAAEPRCPPA